ncbi:MAG: chemotaxis protein CheC [Lachnospiraceae bacterium]|jgi:chemotaxis protein CheC|nr:chemotaxis protein CheC [Lachnospiraceae bacterium]MBR6395460.1 chemotaxis protein CheC [Lachnospiraceae bacterium]MCR4779109.1 chemotaxis protein CheC [Lachnospiraceae bacterium]
MSKLDLNDVGSVQFDVLKEIGNIGAGNATTALSQMINTKVDMQVPKVELLGFQELPDIVGGAEKIVVGILVNLEGDVDGMMMFMVDKVCAHNLVDILMGKKPSNDDSDFDEISLSALQEIGNIIGGAYLNSLSSLTNLVITESIPYLSVDMAGAILSVPAIEFGKIGDKALLIQSRFLDDDMSVDGFFILIPTLESYDKIFGALGL